MGEFRVPETFDVSGFDVGVRWKKYRQKIEIYLSATEKENEKRAEAKKIDIFLNIAGDDCLDIYNLFDVKKKSKLSDVLDAFGNHFEPRQNLAYCGFQFLSRRQQEDETIDQ